MLPMIIPTTSVQTQKAFTLTELAIVLGVIGSILGLVWTAAADVIMTNKVRTVNAELVAIANSVRTIFVEQGGVRGTVTTLTPALDRLRAFPLEMRQDQAVDGGAIFHPWSQIVDAGGLGTVQVGATDCTGAAPATATTPEPCFSVYMKLLPQKACVQVLAPSTLQGTGLKTVVINGTVTSLPIDSNTAKTNCSATTSVNTLQWVYLLRDKS